jgi:hypothetical protein
MEFYPQKRHFSNFIEENSKTHKKRIFKNSFFVHNNESNGSGNRQRIAVK